MQRFRGRSANLRQSEPLSLRVFPAWGEEQPASEEPLDWVSSLREVTDIQYRSDSQTAGRVSDLCRALSSALLTQINVVLHWSLRDFDGGALAGRSFVHVSFLVVLQSDA